MNPIRHDEGQPPPVRQTNCRFYSLCLSVACAREWENWSCSACSDFEYLSDQDIDPDVEAAACRRLLAVVFHENVRRRRPTKKRFSRKKLYDEILQAFPREKPL